MEVHAYNVIVRGRKREVTVHSEEGGTFAYHVNGNFKKGGFRTDAKALGVGVLETEAELNAQHEKYGPANPHYGVMRYPFEYGRPYSYTWDTGTTCSTYSNASTYTVTFSVGNSSTSGTAAY